MTGAAKRQMSVVALSFVFENLNVSTAEIEKLTLWNLQRVTQF